MAGQPGADGQRHRRARHADPGTGRRRGRDRAASSPTATTGSSPRTWPAWTCPMTCSPGPRPATTTRSCRTCSSALYDNGYIFPRKSLGAVSPSTGRTLPDRYIEGTCPICGYDGARGDQCDNCGNQLDPVDLINPALEDQRRDAGLRGDRAVLPRPAGVRRRARQLAAEQERAVAAERAEVLPEPARRPAAAGHHQGPGLGRADPAGRLARPQ